MYYIVAADTIEQLQNAALALVDSVKTVDEKRTILCTSINEKSVRVVEKFRTILSKNSDIARIRQIYGNVFSADLLIQFKD